MAHRKSKKQDSDDDDDSPFSPQTVEKVESSGSESESGEDQAENAIESQEESQNKSEIEGKEEVDSDMEADTIDEKGMTFVNTELMFCIAGSMNDMSKSSEACCSEPIENLNIQVMDKNGALSSLKGKQIIKSVKCTEYNNQFPIAIGGLFTGFEGLDSVGLKYSAKGTKSHVNCPPNTAKDNLDITIMSADSAKTIKFQNKYKGFKLESLETEASQLGARTLIDEKSSLAPVVTRAVSELSKSLKDSKKVKLSKSDIFLALKNADYERVKSHLLSEVKTSLPLGDLSNLVVKAAPLFPQTSQSGEKKQIVTSPWISTQDMEPEGDSLRDGKMKKIHKIYFTLVIAHSPML
jgi:hypothetical protein